MNIQKIKILPLIFIVLALFRCGAQTVSSDAVAALKDERSLKIKSATEIAILSGTGKGASVYFPAGSLDESKTVKIESTDSPSEFQNLQKSDGSSLKLASASSPIQITAGGQIGVQLKTPMTINLPFSNTNLALYKDVEQISDNLCAFLKTKDENSQDQFYIWKKDNMQIDTKNKLAKLTSRKTGIYQLMFCGKESIKDFKDAQEEGVAGLPPDQLSSKDSKMGFLSLRWDDVSYNHGLTRYCLLAGYRTGSGSENKAGVIGSHSGVLKSSGQNTLPLNIDLAKIPSGTQTLYSVVFLQESGSVCPNTYTTENRPKGKVIYSFKINTSEITEGQQKKIVFSQEGAQFTKRAVKIGMPSHSSLSNASISKKKNICISASTRSGTDETSIAVESLLSLEIETDAKLSGKPSWDFFVPNVVSGQSLKVSAQVGKECLLTEHEDLWHKDPSSNAYELNLKNPHTDGVYYFMPLSLTVTTGLPISGQSCLQVYSANTSSLHLDAKNFEITSTPLYLASWLFSLNTAYEILLPWDESKPSQNGKPYYDFKLLMSNCSTQLTSKTAVELNQSSYNLDL